MSPQYDSTIPGKEGQWHPCDLAAEAELKLRGIKHLGIGITKVKPNQPAPYPVMAEAQNELPKAGADDKFPEIRKRGPGRPPKEE